MLELREFTDLLLTHVLTPMGPIPTVHDPDGVYPYESFVETSHRPSLKRYRFISIENDFLRVTLCPDLGGKVHSLYDKRSRKEALFVPDSLCPLRILPRLGFVAGGIEVSFPIAHTPVQLEVVACQTARRSDRLYVWCGERELRFGMRWTVEYSLGSADTFLTQRTCFNNSSSGLHRWTSWSNAALPARADTEFHFPNGPVLCHGASMTTIDWATQGPRRLGDLNRMAGFFWLKPDVCAFGAFTPSLGCGLYHIADPALAPGIKLWSYGIGPHASWSRAGSMSGETYFEMQGGPIRDQSIQETLAPGEQRYHVEFWVPSDRPLAIHELVRPEPRLVPIEEVPWFDWPPRSEVHYWLTVGEAHRANNTGKLPDPPRLEQNLWAPGGMENLGEALRWAAACATGETRDRWLLQWGAWQSARGQFDAALDTLAESRDDRAHALAGRLLLRERHDARAAADSFRRIQSDAMALHPQTMIERDLALAALGSETLAERERWLDRGANCQDEWLIERRAFLLADQGRFQDARALLGQSRFQLVHQRYARSELWRRISGGLGLNEEGAPSWLGEDDLAVFGAYREFE